MKKEIEQRPKHDLMFRCNCGGSHFVCFSYDKEFPEFWVEVIDVPSGFWQRIKNSIKYIFEGGKLYWGEVGLTSKDLRKLRKIIDSYLK